MAEYYTKGQSVAIAAVVGDRIKTHTDPATLAANIDALPDRNILTDAERDKLAALEGSKYLGTFTSAGNIPTVDAVAGSYADVDPGDGSDTQRYIWDVDAASFVASAGQVAGETAASVKTKYESNPNTNAFTDAEKTKLAGLTEAPDIADFVAALDSALT